MLTSEFLLPAHSLGILLCFRVAGVLPRLGFLGAGAVVAVDEWLIGLGRHGAWLNAIHINCLLDLLVEHDDLRDGRLDRVGLVIGKDSIQVLWLVRVATISTH